MLLGMLVIKDLCTFAQRYHERISAGVGISNAPENGATLPAFESSTGDGDRGPTSLPLRSTAETDVGATIVIVGTSHEVGHIPPMTEVTVILNIQ
jgi:hypothetical protein